MTENSFAKNPKRKDILKKMNYDNLVYRKPLNGEEFELAEIRARAMKESLEKIGRYDENKVRRRLLDTYNQNETEIIEFDNNIIGFYSLHESESEFYLKHFYIEKNFQNMGFGTIIMGRIKKECGDKEIRLNTLKESRANLFYHKSGFVKEKEDDLDNYYVYKNIRPTIA